jgi:hypothetical protein
VRQGDHLSSYLFYLGCIWVEQMISNGIWAEHLAGLGPTSNSLTKTVNLQYANGTLIFLKSNEHMVKKIK